MGSVVSQEKLDNAKNKSALKRFATVEDVADQVVGQKVVQ
jgi:hypothetical protein